MYKESLLHDKLPLKVKEKFEEILTVYLLIYPEYRFDQIKSLANHDFTFKFKKNNSRYDLTFTLNHHNDLKSIVFAGLLGRRGETAIRIATTDDKTPIEVLEAAKSYLI